MWALGAPIVRISPHLYHGLMVRERATMRLTLGLGHVLLSLGFFMGCSSSEPSDGSGGSTTATGGAAESGGRSSSGGGEGTGGRTSSSGGQGTGGRTSSSGGQGAAGSPDETCSVFPQDNAWNRDISGLPVHDRSDAFIDSIGRTARMHPDFGTEWEGAPIGIPYVVVHGDQPEVPIFYDAYGEESDPGPFPIPLDAPIEGGPESDGDRHAIAVDFDDCKLYELYRAFPEDDGFRADSGVEWDLKTNDSHPPGCTSADAAGLPIFPGLVRYDEVVERGAILHALRFTVQRSQRAYVAPATHYASSNTDPDLPPMGLRFRMKASYDCVDYSSEAQVICQALKTFGMILADNGSNWYLSGAPDPRWDDDRLGDLKRIPGDAFEVVDTGDPFVTDAPDCEL